MAFQRLISLARALGLCERRCPGCLRPFTPTVSEQYPREQQLCPECAALLRPYGGERCPRCGLPTALFAETPPAADTARATASRPCLACLGQPPPWDGVGFYGLYREDLRHMLLRFKFAGHLYLSSLLGSFLLDAAACLSRPDALVPMPQHPARLLRRGYNQAHELGKSLSRLSGLPLRTSLLRRTMAVASQAQLNATARRSNVRHSFAASPESRGLAVWLVDDIMTTGNTLAAATHALRAAGVARVDVLVVARTPRLDEDRGCFAQSACQLTQFRQ